MSGVRDGIGMDCRYSSHGILRDRLTDGWMDGWMDG